MAVRYGKTRISALLLMCATCMALFCETIAADVNDFHAIEKKTIKAFVKKAKPLIEEVTGRKFKKRIKFELVEREDVTDGLVEDMLPVFRKIMVAASDDEISRLAEQSATVTSQSILGLYLPSTGRLVILPENVQAIVKAHAISEDLFDDFLFLLVVHEMVHMLDDQYFDLNGMKEESKGLEEMQALSCLVEGNAVYVTDEIARRLEIPEESMGFVFKSASGVMMMNDRANMQATYQHYRKGADFVAAVVAAKGPAGVSEAFAFPPATTRQVLNPETYLNPESDRVIDCLWLLGDVTEKLPLEGMTTQSVPVGTMNLVTLLVAGGISEEEASSVADECLSGAIVVATKKALIPKEVYVMAVDFTGRESAAKMVALSEMVDLSKEAQLNARLNASCTVLDDYPLTLEGFEQLRYRHLEKEENRVVTREVSVAGHMDKVYVCVAFNNLDFVVTEEKIYEILNGLKQKRLGAL